VEDVAGQKPKDIRLQALFFASGAAGLMYEVIWARLLADILGSTALSMTAVFSVFLVALAVGAVVVGRLEAEGAAALRVYGWLEVAVAGAAICATVVLLLAESAIARASPGPDRYGASLVFAVVVTTAIIGLPTALMGGTLPMVLASVRGEGLPHSRVARLYGWNTLGAATGTLATGFWLIWKVGLIATVGIAASINLLVGIGVLAGIAGRVSSAAATGAPGPAREPASETSAVTDPRRDRLWLVLAFLSGFVVLALEILWGRLTRFLLGDRTIATTALLFIFVAALGVGSLIAPAVARRAGRRGLATLIGAIFLLSSILHLALLPLIDATLSGGGVTLLPGLSGPFMGRIASLWLLILPPILALGLVFPILAWGASEIDVSPARVIGRLYFVNTAGAALGAAFASFLLSRATGTYGGFIAVTGLAALTGMALLARSGGRARVAALVAAAVIGLLAVRAPSDLIQVRLDETLLDAREDEYGVQVLVETDDGYMRVRNNRLSLIYDLGHPQTAHAQQMAAHLTTLLAGEARSVLNVGTGYGITAGAYTLYDCVGSLETIEILPFLVDHQPTFGPHNFDYVRDDRVTLLQGDGRHALVASNRAYDIISVNVLDPYLPGSSSLYTVDFWELVHERLEPGGVFTQLFWGEDLALLVKGLQSVFPTVLYFSAYGGTSYNVVAFRDAVDAGELQIHLERLSPAAAGEIARLEGADPETGLPRLVRQAWRDAGWLSEEAAAISGPLHTDDRPILEFRWAHGVEGVSYLDSPLVEY
jgi:spermidine synthase